jgi:ABC-type phosphate transport system ATPase subunit
MKHVAAPRVVGLDQLTATGVAQRLQQAARVAADAAMVLLGTTVECDFHVD